MKPRLIVIYTRTLYYEDKPNRDLFKYSLS
jgi:hypothetical protein